MIRLGAFLQVSRFIVAVIIAYTIFSVSDTPKFSRILEKSGFLSPSWTQQDDSADRKNNPKILHSDSNELVQIQNIPDRNSIEADSENSETDGVELVKTGIDVANPEITMTIEDCWKLAHDWLSPREIYPDDSYFDENDNFVSRKSNDISQILHHMATAEIVAADVLPKGTQLKLILELKGKLV